MTYFFGFIWWLKMYKGNTMVFSLVKICDFILQVRSLTSRWRSFHFKKGFDRGKVQHTSWGENIGAFPRSVSTCGIKGGWFFFFFFKDKLIRNILFITLSYQPLSIHHLSPNVAFLTILSVCNQILFHNKV